jgi:arylformamidase
MEYIDISVDLCADLPLWTGSPGMKLTWLQTIDEQNPANVSSLTMEVHTGTHIDAPLHFVKDGKSIEQIDLNHLIGEVLVIDLPKITKITQKDLENTAIPPNTKRLLIKTDNSLLWQNPQHIFQKDFVALTSDAAQWIVAQGIQLVGIDYLSIQLYDDTPLTHQILLNANIVIVETLNLSQVTAGKYELICLPIKIKGAEAAPARVILKQKNDEKNSSHSSYEAS